VRIDPDIWLQFRIQDSGFGVWGLGFGFWVLGFGFWVLGFCGLDLGSMV
jgi:hypothetical protein